MSTEIQVYRGAISDWITYLKTYHRCRTVIETTEKITVIPVIPKSFGCPGLRDHNDGDNWGRRESEERGRNPKMEYEWGQLTKIRERIREAIDQETQYTVTYKGAKDIITIAKYAGQNDNEIFMRWLDHLLIYLQSNQMCGPNHELARLSVMHDSLERGVEEWYRGLVARAPKRH